MGFIETGKGLIFFLQTIKLILLGKVFFDGAPLQREQTLDAGITQSFRIQKLLIVLLQGVDGVVLLADLGTEIVRGFLQEVVELVNALLAVSFQRFQIGIMLQH